MTGGSAIGRIHSLQSLGTVDGPGVRFVVFLQGCNLRCGCCHNPDTQDCAGGTEFTPQQIYERVARCREYFGTDGGITVSGGEPLLQPDFCRELFALCHADGINTCLDTSGSILNEKIRLLLSETDRVLLDIKYTSDELYRKHVGCGLDSVLNFLSYLDERKIPTTVRQVIIPTLNDSAESIAELKKTTAAHPCVDKVELLPFKKICKVKYDSLHREFPFDRFPTPTKEKMEELEALLNGAGSV